MVVRLGGVVTFLQIKKKMLYRNTKVIYSKCYFMGFLNLKHKITLKVQIYINLQNHPTFHSEERLVNTLLVLLVYVLTHWAPPLPEFLDLSENELPVLEAGSLTGLRQLKYLGKNRLYHLQFFCDRNVNSGAGIPVMFSHF